MFLKSFCLVLVFLHFGPGGFGKSIDLVSPILPLILIIKLKSSFWSILNLETKACHALSSYRLIDLIAQHAKEDKRGDRSKAGVCRFRQMIIKDKNDQASSTLNYLDLGMLPVYPLNGTVWIQGWASTVLELANLLVNTLQAGLLSHLLLVRINQSSRETLFSVHTHVFIVVCN